VAERVDGGVDRATLTALGPIPTRPGAAFGRALEGAAIQNHRRGLGGSAVAEPDQFAQVGDDRAEDVRHEPAPGLLVDRLPGRQIVRHVPPLEPSPGTEAQPVEEFAQRVLALRGVLAHERQVRGEEGPFVIGDVGRIGGAGGRVHA